MKHYTRFIANKWQGLEWWLRNAGWRATFSFAAFRAREAFGLPLPPTLTLRPHAAEHPLILRWGDSSDKAVFDQIFPLNQYDCLGKIPAPRFILDLGANVGYASAYFLSRFPSAKVMAVEPDPQNYELCCRNLAPYGDRAQVILGAAWATRSKLALCTFGAGREWATQVHAQAAGEASVEGWDIPSLLELAGEEHIDLLKVDIERSELELFGSESKNWLPDVRNICIELHGPDCSYSFFHALKDFHYDLDHSGELTICQNLRPGNGRLNATPVTGPQNRNRHWQLPITH